MSRHRRARPYDAAHRHEAAHLRGMVALPAATVLRGVARLAGWALARPTARAAGGGVPRPAVPGPAHRAAAFYRRLSRMGRAARPHPGRAGWAAGGPPPRPALPPGACSGVMAAMRRRVAGRPGGDGGAIQVLFGVLVASGMLLAMLAVVVDGGRLRVEQNELRSGADAAAIAVARSCAETGCDLSTGPSGTAGRLADANAGDGAAGITRICGTGPGAASCPAPDPASLATCAAAPPAAGSYVEVATRTELPGGSTILPPLVAGTVFGTYTGTTVGACARAAWGAPTGIDRAFPIMISACAWRQATLGGTRYADPPSPSWDPPASDEVAVSAASAACKSDPSSANGDFAVLLGPSDVTCHQAVTTGDQVPGFPATNLLSGLVTGFCQGQVFLTWLGTVLATLFADARPHVIYLPVYDSVTQTGGGLLATYRYHIAGFAAFEPTGAVFGLLILPSWRTGQLCGLDVPCLRGFFTRKALRGHIAPGGTDYGVSAVQLTG